MVITKDIKGGEGIRNLCVKASNYGIYIGFGERRTQNIMKGVNWFTANQNYETSQYWNKITVSLSRESQDCKCSCSDVTTFCDASVGVLIIEAYIGTSEK